MSAGAVQVSAPQRRFPLLLVFLGASLLLHGAGLLAAARTRLPAVLPQRPTEVVVIEVPPPVRAPEPPPRAEPRPPPPPKVALAPRTPPKASPPPPNDTPPPDPGPPPPVVVGITLHSTTTASAVSVPVGNTLVGKPAEKATAPGEVQPGYAPLYLVDTAPVLLEEINGEEIYPVAAKKAGIEGRVVLAITVGVDGRVSAARVLSGPGHGLNEAALDAIRRARFKPATKGGKPVATDLTYGYTFAIN